MIPFSQHSNVKMHIDCYAELVELIKDDEIPDFMAAYDQRINYLSQHMGMETFHGSWFEILKRAKGLRSIRFMKFRNLRILYMIENGKAYLLLAFEEHQGHKNTEYAQHISTAQKRFEEKENMK